MKTRILISLIVFLFALIAYVILPIPETDSVLKVDNPSFQVSVLNSYEDQPPGQCAGYSSAYILRHYGAEAQGNVVYKEMSFKIPISGYVLPKGIINYFKKLGYEAKIYKGDISTLKSRLTADVPIIVLIGNGHRWQHYMTLIGYSDEVQELYFYDSRIETDENRLLPGNRTLSEDYFMTLWDNGLPIFNHVYIKVEHET